VIRHNPQSFHFQVFLGEVSDLFYIHRISHINLYQHTIPTTLLKKAHDLQAVCSRLMYNQQRNRSILEYRIENWVLHAEWTSNVDFPNGIGSLLNFIQHKKYNGIGKTVSAVNCLGSYWKLSSSTLTPTSYEKALVTPYRPKFLQFTANWGLAQRNGFYYLILVFYAESDSFNNSYQWRSPVKIK